MKRLLPFMLLATVVTARLPAEMLGGDLEVTPATGWHRVDPFADGQPRAPYPVLKFVPKDGRNAAVLMSLVPADAPGFIVTDLDSLKIFNRLAARPYLPAPDARPPVTELKVNDGLGVAMTNEDPALIGKPPPPGEYKIATTVTLLLHGNLLVHATIFHDEKDSVDFGEAMKTILSAVPAVRARPI